MRQILLAIIFLIAGVLFWHLIEKISFDATRHPEGSVKFSTLTKCGPTDYENGVWYFACKGADFGQSISAFKEMNADKLRVISVASDDSGGYGHVIGYFVFTEPIPENKPEDKIEYVPVEKPNQTK